MKININGKFLAVIFSLACSIGIGSYGYKQIEEAKEIESMIMLAHAFGGVAAANNLLSGLANALSGNGNEENSNIVEELTYQAAKNKQIGILALLISLTMFFSSLYFLQKMVRKNKPRA